MKSSKLRPPGGGRTVRERFGLRRRISRLAVRLVALGVCIFCSSGCGNLQSERNCAPPCPEARGETVGSTGTYRAPEPDVFKMLAERLQGPPPAELPPGKRYNVLAISGGGKYGAFSAGVLCGWSEAGTRPTFDVVTGVSTGAIVAVYAFLGTKYDDTLRNFYTTVTTKDILRQKSLLVGLTTKSFASNEPLKRIIDRAVSDELLADLVAAHAEGRRLLIGTTNLDTKRLAVWDLTAIAAGNQPDKAALIRKVILASAAVPGEFPPEQFDIVVNGQRYTELHVDGGASSEVFVRLAHLNVPEEQLRDKPRPLAGSKVYALVSGKVFADPKCARPSLLGVLGGSVSSLIAAMTQNDLLRIYTLALLTGMDFHYTALRQDYQDDGDALNFEPTSLTALYQEGHRVGLTAAWNTQPPGIQRHEQVVPRTGTQFMAPNYQPSATLPK